MYGDHLVQQVEAHYWAVDRLFESLAALTPEQFNQEVVSSFSSIRATMVHALSTETFLLGMLMDERPTIAKLDEIPTVEALKERWAEVRARVQKHVHDRTDWDQLVSVRFPQGSFDLPAWQVLHQLLTHSAYHRGQVTTMLRQVGGQPAKGDAIRYFISQSMAQ
jgi:uncharacterized damage-inducible protein DinB